MFRPTPAQGEAIRTLQGELFIAAGAGSGKTAVLARRFAEAVARGTPAERALAITFTRKAAAELEARIRRVLRYEHARPDAALAMGEAWVSTIHGFCSRLLRRHALEARLPPGFRVADEIETGLLREAAFEEAVSTRERDAGVGALLARFGAARLRATVPALHARLRSMGVAPDDLPLAEPPALREVLGRALAAIEAVLSAHPTPAANATQRDNAAALEAVARALREAGALAGERAAGAVIEARAACRLSRRCRATAGAIQEASEVLDELEDAARLAGIQPHRRALRGLLREFGERYSEGKRRAGVLDQDDLQEAAERLFRRRPDVAEEYARRFELIMVDEFQDTNALQVRVIEPIRRGDLCVVGDERQAIYSFRNADVEVFRQVRAGIDRTVSLDVNFRSRPPLLGFVNALFGAEELFGAGHEPLVPGGPASPTPPESAPCAEVLAVAREGWEGVSWREAEARALARRIRSLVREDGVPPGGVAVLLRALTGAAPYLAALEAEEVPALVAGGGSFASQPEALEMESLLAVAALPHDEEQFATLLLGDMIGLSGGAVLQLRELAEDRGMWAAVTAAAAGEGALPAGDRQRVRALRDAVEALRGECHRRGLGEALVRAIRILGLREALSGRGAAGERAWANVRKLVREAETFGRDETPDAGAFVERLRAWRLYGRSGQAPPPEAAEAVRIMSVHSAKGLEFPVVAVADLGRQVPSVEDLAIAVMRPGGPAWSLALPRSRTGEDGYVPMEHARMRAEEQQRRLAEEKRLLYVACTRGEERLILSGATSLDKGERDDRPIGWVRGALGLAEAVGEPGEREAGGARYVLEVVRPEDEPDAAPAREAPTHPRPSTPPVPSPPPGPAAAEAENAPEEPVENPQPEEPAAGPASLSFTALHTFTECPYRFYVERVAGLRAPGRDAGPMAFGSAAHAALETLGEQPLTDARIDAIASVHGLPSEEIPRLAAAVRAFAGSPLAARAEAEERIGREVPFAVMLDGTPLTGAMDLVSWFGERVLVVDYKTGAGDGTGDRSGGEAYRLQAECYALALLESGAGEVEVAFVALERGSRITSSRFRSSDAARLRERLEGLARDALGGPYRPRPRYDRRVCGGCPALGGLCPVRRLRRRPRGAA